MNIGDWLRSLGLERYEKAFRENDIDVEVLPSLTAEDLIGLGVTSIGTAAECSMRSPPCG
jgi:SAM (Sterile alpha motif) domain-containing protein